MESGQRGLIMETRRRVLTFLREVSRLGVDRLVRVCLQEELRGIGNSTPSPWGKTPSASLEQWEGRDLLEVLRNGEIERKEYKGKLKEYIERGEAREMVEDDRRSVPLRSVRSIST